MASLDDSVEGDIWDYQPVVKKKESSFQVFKGSKLSVKKSVQMTSTSLKAKKTIYDTKSSRQNEVEIIDLKCEPDIDEISKQRRLKSKDFGGRDHGLNSPASFSKKTYIPSSKSHKKSRNKSATQDSPIRKSRKTSTRTSGFDKCSEIKGKKKYFSQNNSNVTAVCQLSKPELFVLSDDENDIDSCPPKDQEHLNSEQVSVDQQDVTLNNQTPASMTNSQQNVTFHTSLIGQDSPDESIQVPSVHVEVIVEQVDRLAPCIENSSSNSKYDSIRSRDATCTNDLDHKTDCQSVLSVSSGEKTQTGLPSHESKGNDFYFEDDNLDYLQENHMCDDNISRCCKEDNGKVSDHKYHNSEEALESHKKKSFGTSNNDHTAFTCIVQKCEKFEDFANTQHEQEEGGGFLLDDDLEDVQRQDTEKVKDQDTQLFQEDCGRFIQEGDINEIIDQESGVNHDICKDFDLDKDIKDEDPDKKDNQEDCGGFLLDEDKGEEEEEVLITSSSLLDLKTKPLDKSQSLPSSFTKQTDIFSYFKVRPGPGNSSKVTNTDGKSSLNKTKSDAIVTGRWQGTTSSHKPGTAQPSRQPGGQRQEKQCPFYKKIPGTSITVDAFRYGIIPGCEAYVLTHFHYDHYGGLTKKFAQPIYCSQVTGNLVESRLGVDKRYINRLLMWQKCTIAGTTVTLMEANHCPGAVIILFELKDGRKILHTGDFRANREMETYSSLQGIRISELYLDTTYCNPSYAFPDQTEVVNFVVDLVLNHISNNPSTLIVCGAYTIGKERIFTAIAKALETKICVMNDKKKVLDCLKDDDLKQRVSLDWSKGKVHVLPMGKLNLQSLREHHKRHSHFKTILAFQPTGWTHTDKGASLSQLAPKWSRDGITLYGVPYSEHSSYLELKQFVQHFRPTKILPTVNNGNPASRAKMEAIFKQWMQEIKT